MAKVRHFHLTSLGSGVSLALTMTVCHQNAFDGILRPRLYIQPLASSSPEWAEAGAEAVAKVTWFMPPYQREAPQTQSPWNSRLLTGTAAGIDWRP